MGFDGMSVTFMKVADGKLDPKDSYESEWVGTDEEKKPTKIGGDGTPVVGIVGKSNANGTTVADREVLSGHLWHTYLQAVGLDSTKSFYPNERPVPIADPKTAAISELLA